MSFGVYLDQILSLKNFENYYFLSKFFVNFYFSIKIKKNTIFFIKLKKFFFFYIDTRLLWVNSREEMYEIVSRLMRFGVYFEITFNRK